MTIYEGGNIYKFMWEDFQDFQGYYEVRSKPGTSRGGTIKDLMQTYEEWRMKEYQKYNIKKKEVIKKMAIDYKKEWDKLRCEHGKILLQDEQRRTLGLTMEMQIENTINKREKLMKHYLISGMKTDITGENIVCHHVQVNFYNNIFKIFVSKRNFDAWCKKKRGGK